MNKRFKLFHDSVVATDSIEFQNEDDCKKYFDEMTEFFQNDGVRVILKSNLVISVEYKAHKGVLFDKYIKDNFWNEM